MLIFLILLITGATKETETVIEHKTTNDRIRIEIEKSSQSVEIIINNNDIKITKPGSPTEVHRIFERYEGKRFPSVNIYCESSVSIFQESVTSDLNVTISASRSVSFKGENSITVFKWFAISPLDSSAIIVEFHVSVPYQI